MEPAPLARFLDFLAASGITYWQTCPLGPTGYGDSPYQCFSAFAGNPYLIDLKALAGFGLLGSEDLAVLRSLSVEHVDFGRLWETKWRLLFRAHRRFRSKSGAVEPYGSFDAFCRTHAGWLDAYAFFRALKDHYDGAPWWLWPESVRNYASAKESPLRKELAQSVEAHAFFQYLFFGQWAQVRVAAAARKIQIVGDIPIFVAQDSADAWSEPQLFETDPKTGRPTAVAGVPPDYFSADGQLWGNPLYRWETHRADGFAWWRSRMEASFEVADVVRIDHFRGFDTYWSVPAEAKTARKGKWLPGPGIEFFVELKKAFPEAKIIAEDLGEIGPSVIRLREQTGLPGMAILQFAFGGDSANSYLPHNHTGNSVVYPGTHDNDTTRGWYASAPEKTRDHVRRYLRVPGHEIGWDFVREAYASVCRLAVFPMQDLLSLGTEARLNRPGYAQGNWQWRYLPEQLEALAGGTARYLRELGELYGRVPLPEKKAEESDAPAAPETEA